MFEFDTHLARVRALRGRGAVAAAAESFALEAAQYDRPIVVAARASGDARLDRYQALITRLSADHFRVAAMAKDSEERKVALSAMDADLGEALDLLVGMRETFMPSAARVMASQTEGAKRSSDQTPRAERMSSLLEPEGDVPVQKPSPGRSL
jgi:hypothetical protein